MEIQDFDFDRQLNKAKDARLKRQLATLIPTAEHQDDLIARTLTTQAQAAVLPTSFGRVLRLVPTVHDCTEKDYLAGLCGEDQVAMRVIDVESHRVRVQDSKGDRFMLDSDELVWVGKIIVGHGSFNNRVFTLAKKVERPLSTVAHTKERHRLIFAAGPFTSGQDLSYLRLKTLCAAARKLQPHTIILMGPFLHQGNDQLLKGLAKEDKAICLLQRLFESVLKQVALSLPGVRILVQPSCSDVHHPFVLPQRSFALGVPGVESLMNPALLEGGNGSLISVVNTDVVRAIEKSKYMPPSIRKNVLEAELQQILMQPTLIPATLDPVRKPWCCHLRGPSPSLVLMSTEFMPQVKEVRGAGFVLLPGLQDTGYFAVLQSEGKQTNVQIMQLH